MKSEPKEDKLSCEECNRSFGNKVDLKLHEASQHLGILHTCDECEHSFKYEKLLKKHMRKQHPKVQYECDKCGKKFILKYLLDDHMETKHFWTIVKCDKCEKSMSNSTYDTHICSVNESPTKNIPLKSDFCQFCGKENIHDLSTHQKTCEILFMEKFQNNAFQCSGCKRSYNRSS